MSIVLSLLLVLKCLYNVNGYKTFGNSKKKKLTVFKAKSTK